MQQPTTPDRPRTIEQRRRLLWHIYMTILSDLGSTQPGDEATEEREEDSEQQATEPADQRKAA